MKIFWHFFVWKLFWLLFSKFWPIFSQSPGHRGQGINRTAYWPILPVQEIVASVASAMEALFKNVKIVGIPTFTHLLIYSSGGQNSNLFLNVAHFSTPVLIRHLWQLKTVVFLHRCLICALLL